MRLKIPKHEKREWQYPIPEYKPLTLLESARSMSFCQFQREKFEALFSPSGALRYRRRQEHDHPEWFR